MSAGTYMLRVGTFFYIGSSGNLRKRKQQHSKNLMKGEHHNRHLQSAFLCEKEIKFIPLEFIHRGEDETICDYTTRLRVAEQLLLDRYAKDPNLCNLNVFAAPSDFFKSRWADPEFRNMMLAEMRANREPMLEDTRKRMSLAKKGHLNPNSRPVIVTDPDEMEMEFDSVTAVAEFFGVTQQTMDLWMSGKVKWPAPGKGRKVNRWVAGYKARFKEPCESSPEPQPTR